jgi:hypothetical protein
LSRDEHRLQPDVAPAEATAGRARPSLWTLWLLIGIATIGFGAGISFLMPAAKGDSVPPDLDARRQAAFSTLKPIPVVVAASDEEERVVQAMPLPAAEKQMLLATVREERAALAGIRAVSAPEPKAVQKAVAAPAAKPARPIGLAHITVWDTDAVDGDVVRIVSAGFAMEVTLAKAPMTIAVPIPPQGVINVVGVHDGGGGITAGVSVGGRAVELPIMSPGQVLGIPVAGRF